MWLRNYYNLLSSLFLQDGANYGPNPGAPSSYGPPIRVRNCNGDWVTPYSGNIISALGVSWDNSNVLSKPMVAAYFSPLFIGKMCTVLYQTEGLALNPVGIGLSSDSTPVTYEDYTMNSLINSGLSLGSQSGAITQSDNFNSDTKIYSGSRAYTVTNNSASNITIRSFGIYVSCSKESNYGRQFAPVLVYREVLDEAITLAPGESIIFTFTRSAEPFNYTPY